MLSCPPQFLGAIIGLVFGVIFVSHDLIVKWRDIVLEVRVCVVDVCVSCM